MKRSLGIYLLSPWLLMAAEVVSSSVDTGDGFQASIFKSGDGGTIPYRLFSPDVRRPNEKYPLILFLHGFEALGKDNKKQISGMDRIGSHIWTSFQQQATHPCFVLAPQCPRGGLWANPFTRRPTPQLQRVMQLLLEIQSRYPVDPSRIYVTGQSMGGFGTWALLTDYPGYFAAGVPVCGGGSTARANALAFTAIWAFHGAADPLVPAIESRRMVNAIRKAGGNPRYTEYPHKLHRIWDTAYSEPGLIDWLFRQHRGRVIE